MVILTGIYPYDYVLPLVLVAKISTVSDDLVLRPVPGIHDGKTLPIPSSSNVRLAIVPFAAAASRSAGVLETSADLTVSAYSGIWLAAVGDMEVRFEPAHRISNIVVVDVLWDRSDRVMGNDIESLCRTMSFWGGWVGCWCCRHAREE